MDKRLSAAILGAAAAGSCLAAATAGCAKPHLHVPTSARHAAPVAAAHGSSGSGVLGGLRASKCDAGTVQYGWAALATAGLQGEHRALGPERSLATGTGAIGLGRTTGGVEPSRQASTRGGMPTRSGYPQGGAGGSPTWTPEAYATSRAYQQPSEEPQYMPPPPAPVAQPPQDYQAYARWAAQRAGIDPEMFYRQINQESRFDPSARGSSGEVGIAQIPPRFHPGVEPRHPRARTYT